MTRKPSMDRIVDENSIGTLLTQLIRSQEGGPCPPWFLMLQPEERRQGPSSLPANKLMHPAGTGSAFLTCK